MQAVVRIQWELTRIAVHRCCCPSWKVFIMELRRETLSVVRAALLGPRHDEVIGLGVYSVPPGGLNGSAANLVVPLLTPPTADSARAGAKGSPKAMSGQLHVHVIGKQDRPAGECGTVVEIRGATQLPADLYGGQARHESAVVVRVIAFECVPDAKAHVQAFKTRQAEPTPCGHAYARTTAPGKAVAQTIVFEDCLEFYGLGDEAAAATQARLSGAVSACFAEVTLEGATDAAAASAAAPAALAAAPAATAAPPAAAAASPPSGGNGEPTPAAPSPRQEPVTGAREPAVREPLLRQFPPTVGDAERAEQAATAFSIRVVPWLACEDPPPRWL